MNFKSHLNATVLAFAASFCGISYATGNTTFASIEENHKYWSSLESDCYYVYHKDSDASEIYMDFDGRGCQRATRKFTCSNTSNTCVNYDGSITLKSLPNKNLVQTHTPKDGDVERRVLYYSKSATTIEEGEQE